MAECQGNTSPPADNYDFDICRVAEKPVYLTALGTPCQYIHILDEDAFITPSNSEETELSSDENIPSKSSNVKNVPIPPTSSNVKNVPIPPTSSNVKNVPIPPTSSNVKNVPIPSKSSNVKNVPIPSKSSNVPKIKEEKLSDSEESSKSSKQTTKKKKKAKKNPVVEYTDSENSEEGEIKSSPPKSRHKKYSSDSGEERYKNRHKKYSTASEEERYKNRHKKYSSDSEEERYRNRHKKYSSDSEDERYKNRQKKHSKEERKKSQRKKYSDDSDEEQYRSYQKEYSRRPIKNEEFEEIEYENKYTPGLTAAFGTYHCQVCDIVVNSEVTYQTHIQGKRHLKALKAKSVPGLVMQSLNEPRLPPKIAPPVIKATPNSPVKKVYRMKLNEQSLIQRITEEYRDGPVPGLSHVVEVRPPHKDIKDISYNCELCEAKCVPNSIMKHLTGFKHYLRCLEEIDPSTYGRHKYTAKKQIEGLVIRILDEHEKRCGRGRIRVEKEVVEDYNPRDEPGPSWRDEPLPPPSSPDYLDEDFPRVSCREYLDTSMSDFYCKVCDAHMNNQAMWESHVRGKRHLKNIKKIPGESTSKIKSVHCPGETARIMELLNSVDLKDEYGYDIPLVGLGYIKETQGENGELYNCFLCGSCTSSHDIVDHLLLTKHKVKYLEDMNAKGFSNSIETIKSSFPGFSSHSKESIINNECRESIQKYGRGKIAVYRSKVLF